MDSTIHEFPAPPKQPDLLVGPFEEWRVMVEGRIIPRLTGHRQEDGRITLIVDRRFMADFAPDVARQAAWLIAQALAVGAGYPWLGATSKDKPFAPQAAEILPGDVQT
jgi:hypothetical protein